MPTIAACPWACSNTVALFLWRHGADHMCWRAFHAAKLNHWAREKKTENHFVVLSLCVVVLFDEISHTALFLGPIPMSSDVDDGLGPSSCLLWKISTLMNPRITSFLRPAYVEEERGDLEQRAK